MMQALTRSRVVGGRVLQQLRHDRRFLALSLIAPLLIIFLLKVFFDSLTLPLVEPQYVVVPVGAFVVHFLTYVLTAIGLVRERTAQTLARMFVSGYGRGEILVGYLLAYSTLATVQSALVLSELNWLFDLRYGAEKFLSLYLVMWFLAVISMALGMLVSTFCRTEGQVFPFIPTVILPSVFLSGILIDVERMPGWAQALSRMIPLYYANEVLQVLITPDGTLAGAWLHLIGLPAYGIVILAVASRTLREVD